VPIFPKQFSYPDADLFFPLMPASHLLLIHGIMNALIDIDGYGVAARWRSLNHDSRL